MTNTNKIRRLLSHTVYGCFIPVNVDMEQEQRTGERGYRKSKFINCHLSNSDQ